MAAPDRRALRITVVYLRPGLTFERKLLLPRPVTVAEAIEASGVRAEVAELRAGALRVGVFSRQCESTERLRDGDRVEIYRPLSLDPKEARRLRAVVRRGNARTTAK